MKVWIILDSEHHFNQALALYNRYQDWEITLVFSGPQSENVKEKIPQDMKFWEMDSRVGKDFFSIEKKARPLIENLKLDGPPEHLITFYDTYILFLYLKYYFRISWSDVSLIEDGFANYIPVSMPSLSNRIIKALINFFLRRFKVPISRYSLGLNKSVRNIFSIFPSRVKGHKNLNIIDLKDEYKDILSNYRCELDIGLMSASESGCIEIILVPPILSTRGLSQKKIEAYVEKLIMVTRQKQSLFFKLHPREGQTLERLITKMLDKKGMKAHFLDYSRAIEYYFENLQKFSLIGPASTAHLIAINFYRDKKEKKIMIVPDLSNPFCRRHIAFLRKFDEMEIIGDLS